MQRDFKSSISGVELYFLPGMGEKLSQVEINGMSFKNNK